MDMTEYPVLPGEVSLSRVYTEEGEDNLLYNTKTKVKAHPNAAVYEFAKRCRGDKSLNEIIVELSCISGESPEDVQKDVLELIKEMEANDMISFVVSPLDPPRPEPVETTLVRRLTSIIFEITNKCNLRCKHCYTNAGAKKEDELSTKEIKELIDYLATIGVVNIVISGGEPLLHPDFFDILAYVRSKPMSVIVFTNGTLVTEKVVQQFKALSILSVVTSLDGATPGTNDSFRGVLKSYEKIIESIKLFKKYDIPVRVNVCLHKGVLSEIDALLDLFKKLHITDYSIWPVSYTGRPDNADFVITPEEYRTVMEQLKEYEFAEGVKNEFPYNPRLINCGIGRSSLTIKSDGTVVSCSPFPDSMSLGNIREDSLTEIWNTSAFLKKVRCISVFESDMCKECQHASVCLGGCMANNYRTTGEIGCGDPYECVYFDVYKGYTAVKVTRKRHLSVEIR